MRILFALCLLIVGFGYASAHTVTRCDQYGRCWAVPHRHAPPPGYYDPYYDDDYYGPPRYYREQRPGITVCPNGDFCIRVPIK